MSFVSETDRLTTPRILRDLMTRHGFTLKKQLGQNFLIDPYVLDAIVAASGVGGQSGVLEIGPGAGVVTRELAARAKRVLAVEKDRALEPVLAETLAPFPNATVQFADFLQTDVRALWRSFEGCDAVSVVANLPYYITTPILFHLLDAGVNWQRIVVMVQKEVADRLSARPGGKEYGALSVAVQYHAAVQTVLRVPNTAFLPPPGVDSAVVRMDRRDPPAVVVQNERLFFQVVRAAFATRRKTLQNALTSGLGRPKEDIQAVLAAAGIDGQRRGETLDVREFGCIADVLNTLS
ncbi:16S rRNA (adenine(1518)-N(6)/adenine(1519)-N(6))-dimethyltransferase RsmA [Alicyclobacillus cycloheptanicus]|uniref:Ribosomal RNA small subunit methyltransferase A n=1 Tax=Alicyclobacillus cycloheptanicus TaxID=1457 RepID=A0ABT9XJF4_9BACL|nr:16S rRNA (adenine(1518)-N(6)/adenine(1519)-N(6))-dimethyltransferase RsmA [Alicyclobacillus cycloheptanicus]MDQ0190174.1 16S rRNA (adenine1518-N6/adenine1519-N6)-dimethyltransferase [Alicyclobacillus cycloheptanicus]WDM02572.1 16S rRNA (adenine(1518)-N(6)/adenine(1519)-N(6))-dimethyltransferase RsmA [Alicyclobacillus cycloheptanicus]